jgi:hypothetical protein
LAAPPGSVAIFLYDDAGSPLPRLETIVIESTLWRAKGKIVPIRFTKAEAEQLTGAAKAKDQTLSEWIRRTALAALE